MEDGQQIREAALVSLPLSGGPARTVTAGTIGGKPHFGPEPGVAYLQTMTGLGAVNLASGEMKPAMEVRGPGWYFAEGTALVDDTRVSPDGQAVLVLTPSNCMCSHNASTGKGDRSFESRPCTPANHRRRCRFLRVGRRRKDHHLVCRIDVLPPVTVGYHAQSADRPDWSADVPRVGMERVHSRP
jgi:hypothetical protein